MFKTTKDFNNAMFNILTDINKGVPINEIADKFDDTDFDDAFEQCYYTGLVKGVSEPLKSIKGKLHFSILGEVRLTYKGLSFIENFNS